MRYLWLVFAISLLLIGLAVGRLLKLPQPVAYAVAWAPSFLATFPFMKRWMPNAKFVYWVFVAAVSTALNLAIYWFGFV